MLNQSIKEQIQDLHKSKSESGVNSVFIGYKTTNGIRTSDLSVVFGVDKKIHESNIPQDYVLPKMVTIDGSIIKTDVIEISDLKALTCYPSGDQNVERLRSFPTIPVPFKGGMQISEFPTAWSSSGGVYSYTVGTLGFFAKDNIDGRVVGVTNAHVLINKLTISSERNIQSEINDPYNISEKRTWVDGNNYFPSASIFSSNTGMMFNIALPFEKIKKYIPLFKNSTNYVDCSIITPKPEYIDDSSYQVWQPINQTTYPSSMPFATTAELDNLLATNPTVYCTGRTSGPIGWGTGECKINITGVGATVNVGYAEGTFSFSDQIIMQTPLNAAPMAGGDSGSCVMADIGGIRKIIGLMFAGNSGAGSISVFNRIDRVASEAGISQFTSPPNTLVPTARLYSASLDTYGSSKSIVLNGKLYYQSGLTKNVYNE